MVSRAGLLVRRGSEQLFIPAGVARHLVPLPRLSRVPWDSAQMALIGGEWLDLVQDTIRRLGGTIRLHSCAGGGLTATFEVPSDHTVVEVLWLEELGQRFALPVSFTGRLAHVDQGQAPATVRLARCLGQPSAHPGAISLELTVYGIAPIHVSLDAVGDIEQVGLRALPDLMAERGPYGGAVLQSDGTLYLALDAPLVAARAWTLRHADSP